MKRTTMLSNARTTTVISSDNTDPVAAIPVQGGGEDQDGVPEEAEPEVGPDPENGAIEAEQFTDEPLPQTDLHLDEDPDTSLVGSIYLHLLSEHACYDALHLSDDEAIAYHEQLHQNEEKQLHQANDWRFRPGQALAVSMRGTDSSTFSPHTDQVADSPTDPPTV